MGLHPIDSEKYYISKCDKERVEYYHSEKGREELVSTLKTLRKLNDNQLVLYFQRLFGENNGKGIIIKRLGSIEMYGNVLFKAYNTVMRERNCQYIDIKCENCGAVGYMVFPKDADLKGIYLNKNINGNFGDEIRCECGAKGKWKRIFFSEMF